MERVRRLTRAEREARDKEIVAAVLAGEVQEQIAARLGLTRQRVSFIFKEAGLGISPNLQRRREAYKRKRERVHRRLEADADRRRDRKDLMERIRHLVEVEGLSITKAAKSVGVSLESYDYWHSCLGFSPKSRHGPGSKGKPKLQAKAVAVPPPAEHARAVVDGVIPELTHTERRALSFQRYHARMRGKKNPASIDDLRAIVRASDKPVHKFSAGAHAGWKPSWF